MNCERNEHDKNVEYERIVNGIDVVCFLPLYTNDLILVNLPLSASRKEEATSENF